MKVNVRKRKPAPVAMEQVKDRTFGQIKRKCGFLEEFCFKNSSTVKPQNLTSLNDCRNARN